MNKTELVMRRRNVAAFIQADPASVSFIRVGEKVKTGAGGWVPGTPVPLAPQTIRIVQSKRRYDAGLTNSEAGEIPDSQLLLIGHHTLNIQKEDIFQWRGSWYKVKGIKNERAESTLAAIDRDGPPNG